MIQLSQLYNERDEINVLIVANKGKIHSNVHTRIRDHVTIIKTALTERINELSDIADNSSEWSKKKDSVVPRLQRERSQLVAMLEFWSGKGF
ncbi:hypothetical protein HY483_01970 [Candidatus Woesearchaeota archaeon]|nr:hypothetical protein [Candidatus Woesearchaeota archaeon]